MSDENSGGMTGIVAIVAIVIILGIGYFVFQNLQRNTGSNPSIDITLPAGDTAE